MSTLTITSPGVQINEVDLSIIARPIGTTDVLITGFAPQGPTEEIVNVGSVSEFESIFGTPTNAAERYLYYSAKQILSQSPSNLMVSRIPYGPNLGEGYTNSYSALVYPISSNKATYSESTEYRLLEPTSVLLSDAEYYKLVSDNINWSDTSFEYVNGNDSFIFGSLTNATSSVVTTSERIYGISTKPIASLSVAELEERGLGSTPISEAYSYIEALWDTPEGETTIYNAVSVTEGVQTLKQVYNYYASASEDPNLAAAYGDSTLVYEITSYAFEEGVFVNEITSVSDVLDGKAGMIVLNTAKTSVNNLFEGYYVGIADNSNINPATPYDSVQSIVSVNGNDGVVQNYVTVPTSRLNFSLTQTASAYTRDSLSKVIEQYPIGFDFSTESFKDSLIFVLFKIKSTQYSQDTIQLDYVVSEGFAGSLNAARTQNNPYGGTPVSFFADTIINNQSNNIRLITNPFITSQGDWTQNNGIPSKKVSVDSTAKKAYPVGVYTSQSGTGNKDLGRIDLKISRFLDVLANDDTTNIDIIADAGLSTIWATAYSQKVANNTESYLFDETYTPIDIDNVSGIGNTSVNVTPTGVTLDAYQAITNRFVSFAEARRDHIFISDPLRQIFVRGQNAKVSSRKNYVFSNDIYWPLNNIYNNIQSSYVVTYGNWIKSNDVYTSKPVWLPSSGYATAVIARASQATFPWIAPAGFNRGTLVNVQDIGINPTQKQRDLLYKINVNPIAYFNTDGYVIYGQKTMYRKPSAFDRINVRRLFLTLEKATQRLLKYYVFEPNDFATRNRLKGALTPIFDQARLNDGCYDYLLVCDTTNNTPDVIDNNQLKISIYIQPVRSAEFILADFIATRTGVNFSELIAGGQS